MSRFPHICMAAALMVCATAALAEAPRGLPPAIVPQPFGVNIHFVTPNEAEVDALAAIGYRAIRMDFAWGGTERRKGEYEFSGYDKLVASMSRRGIRCVFILDYSNRLYDNGLAPHTDEGRAAFAKWAAAAAQHFAGKGILWEIWNEPNIVQFWKPTPSAEDYAKLADAVIEAVRKADPQAFIMGPASSTFPWGFFDTLAQRGVLAKFDAISVHPYRQSAPETAAADYLRLRLLIDKVSPNKYLPIVSGEWGYSTGWGGMTEQKQAQYIARQWLFNLCSDVGLSIWYDWKDDGPDPKEPEHHFGSVYMDLNLKPSATAARTLTETLNGYQFLRRLATKDTKDYVLLFKGEGSKLALAAWTLDAPHGITIPLPAGKARLIEMLGASRELAIGQQGLSIEVGPSPQYVLTNIADEQLLKKISAWRPQRSIETVRAGAQASLAIQVTSDLPSYAFELKASETRLGQLRGSSAAAGTALQVPAQLKDFSQPSIEAEIHSTLDGADDLLQSARVTLLVANHIQASALPEAHFALVENPSGEPLEAVIRLKMENGETAMGPLDLAKGQTQTIAVLGVRAMSAPWADQAKARIQAGKPVIDLQPMQWRTLDLAGEWRLGFEGDRQVEATGKVMLADAPAGWPQDRHMKSLHIEYRFASGWKYAVLMPPTSQTAIEGKPHTFGMWVHGDGSGNTLRCRYKDSTNQWFQATAGPMDWTGWKWITMPIDGREAHHWGGANDGVVHYPISWNSVLLIDSARQKTGQDLHVYATGFAIGQ